MGNLVSIQEDDKFRRLTRNETRKRLTQNEGIPNPNWQTIEQYAPQVAPEIIASGVFKGKGKGEIQKQTTPRDPNIRTGGKPRGKQKK